ncbi:MAG TPA: hydantoinase/oxoprolinase family protein [Frankiaceae bacterium]|nr:hydantoinase/oxoprolinase family protein [Frankiaceae bacterium]
MAGAATVGVDVGGTFTDVVVDDGSGVQHVVKVLTTPQDALVGVRRGLETALTQARVAASAVSRVVHGTTLATNVILERRGARTAFVTTEGFGDLFRLGREARVEEDRYDLLFQPVRPPLEHALTFEAPERMNAAGQPLTELDPAAAKELADRIARSQPESVAVCFLHSWANPAHEELMAEALRAALPQAYVAISCEVWPELREHERGMTTLLSAYVGPVMSQYLQRLHDLLRADGFSCPVYVMDSAGGVMSAEQAARRPIFTIESGGAAGVVAAGQLGVRYDLERVLSFDMGGTTAKAGLVLRGQPRITHHFEVSGKGSFGVMRAGSGLPVKTPVVDLAEVGAGGGSIAWVDGTGALRVGPRSAGADPGPACYGRGGTEPTVTDANLMLGYLDPSGLADGVTLDVAAAETALTTRIAGPLGMRDGAEAARAVRDIAVATMAAAIRVVTVQRGEDPREAVMVAFGGAGPMFAVDLARVFGMSRIVVPAAAGVGSAVGLLHADLSVEQLRTRVLAATAANFPAVMDIFGQLSAAALDSLDQDPGRVTLRHSIDIRYRGQAHQLPVLLSEQDLHAGPDAILAAFRVVYESTYGVAQNGPAEFVTYRVRAIAPFDAGQPAAAGTAARAGAAPTRTRRASFSAAEGFLDVPVLRREDLGAGERVAGPAFVEGPESTTLLPPGALLTVDTLGTLHLWPEGKDVT